MKVEDLRDILKQLAALLEASEARKATVTGLAAFLDGTVPFAELTLAQFLNHAAAGMNPPELATGGRSGRGGGRGKAVADETLTDDVTSLYAKVSHANVSEEEVQTMCDRVAAVKNKPPLKAIGEKIEVLFGKSDTVAKMAERITGRLLSLKRKAIKDSTLLPPGHRPPLPTDTVPD